MRAEDKAKELIANMLQHQMIVHDEKYSLEKAKQCALICVDEKIKTYRMLFPLLEFDCDIEESKYYIELKEVKANIEKL